MSDLQVHLLRREHRVADDTIRVWRRPENTFFLTYTDGETGRVHTHTYTKDAFRGYMWMVLYMLTIDSDPFRYLQVNGVGFPSILVSLSEFDTLSPTWTAVNAVIGSFAEGFWTTRPRVSVPSGPSRQTGPGDSQYTSRGASQSVPASDSASSSRESGIPQSSEWGGEVIPTIGPSSVDSSG